MKASQSDFDQYDGHAVTAFHLENDNGVSATILSMGGIIHEYNVPSPAGETTNVLLSYPHTKDYYANPFYVNMLIGPAAGRIKQATFDVAGETIKVTPNEGDNALHGGPHGFSFVNWDGTTDVTEDGATLTLHHQFEQGAGDFPSMDVTVTYQLSNDDRLTLSFSGQADAPTLFNPTCHTYFNVDGSYTIKSQQLQLNSTRHLAVDAEKLPTGDFLDNAGTPYDFSQPTQLGTAIDGMADTTEKGFDDIFEVAPAADHEIAQLKSTDSNRSVTLYSARNALVVFTANSFTDDMALVNGHGHGTPWMGVALEAQNLSDATRFTNFGDITLLPGEPKHYEIAYQVHY
ncbi:aldose epimerase family protein [Secundilactobacillus kimchicus]|uniref:aldose epimerase family protein n=1 Tax=Secundilactobacillus kimchicus TaxID=528209 RepID=UPI0024A7C1C4|nr:aldose epimerase family protein [Secundilactobacillus kimchicus]